MATAAPGQPETDAALRAEHDALAERLQVRRSVDELRRVAYAGFASFISFALTLKLAWDRWGWSKLAKPPVRGRYPIFFLLALAVFTALLVLAVRAWKRARVLRREEDALYARFRALRDRLRLDP